MSKTPKQIQALLAVLSLAASTGHAAAVKPEIVNHGTIVNVNPVTLPELAPTPAARRQYPVQDEAAAIRALDDSAFPPVQAPAPIYRQPEIKAALKAPVKDPHERGLSLGGPRFGISYSSGEGYEMLKKEVAKSKPGASVEPTMSQFGWQIEYRMFRTDAGLTALTEFIPLLGGMDQGLALPSATWLVGLRGANGFEVGVGPNFGLSGVAMMVGAGFTFDVGGINIPVNLAYGRGANQTTSIAFSTGFNL